VGVESAKGVWRRGGISNLDFSKGNDLLVDDVLRGRDKEMLGLVNVYENCLNLLFAGTTGGRDGTEKDNGQDPDHAEKDANTAAKDESHDATLPEPERHQGAVEAVREAASFAEVMDAVVAVR